MATSRSSIGSHARYTVAKWPLPILCRSSSGPQRAYHSMTSAAAADEETPDPRSTAARSAISRRSSDESPLLAASGCGRGGFPVGLRPVHNRSRELDQQRIIGHGSRLYEGDGSSCQV